MRSRVRELQQAAWWAGEEPRHIAEQASHHIMAAAAALQLATASFAQEIGPPDGRPLHFLDALALGALGDTVPGTWPIN